MQKMIAERNEYAWLSYSVQPILLLVQTVIPALFIHMILVFRNIEINFSQVFKISLIARFTYFLLQGVQLTIAYTSELKDLTLEKYYEIPFSIASLFNKEEIVFPLYALLVKFNVFEYLYIYLLASGLMHFTKNARKESYLLSLFIWVVFICFSVLIQSFLKLTMQ